MTSIGVVLLAAGASERLGKPKQLLVYNGETLLQHALNAAVTVSPESTVLVLGANAEILQQQLGDSTVHVVINTGWSEGMASSIRCGLSGLLELQPAVDGVIIMVCDQPFVTEVLLNELIAQKAVTRKKIIACTYNNAVGVPVLFDKAFFPELLALKGQEGAKKIIQQHAEDVSVFSFPFGYIDIDTMDDYDALNK